MSSASYQSYPGSYEPMPGGAPAMPVKRSNGFAVAGLILGILPTGLIGLIFSILGIVRATKVKRGMVMSIIGLVLSLVWMAGGFLTVSKSPRFDPGCAAATKVQDDYPDSKLTADGQNPQVFTADLQDMIKRLNDGADVSRSSTIATALRNDANDLSELLKDLQQGQAPSAALQARANADDAALQDACNKLF